jgi:hypothetical protein
VKDKELIELDPGEARTISVPKFLKDYATLNHCLGNAKITISTDAPDFVKLSTQED